MVEPVRVQNVVEGQSVRGHRGIDEQRPGAFDEVGHELHVGVGHFLVVTGGSGAVVVEDMEVPVVGSGAGFYVGCVELVQQQLVGSCLVVVGVSSLRSVQPLAMSFMVTSVCLCVCGPLNNCVIQILCQG